jgi:hypothetical protein
VAKPTETPAPWGWKGNQRNREVSSNTLKGDIGEAAESLKKMVGQGSSEEKPHVGWPYREEKFEFGGKEYKVTRKPRVKKTNTKGVSKPWGW